MKGILISAMLLCGTCLTAQTNRINHFSHSGSITTLNIFKANDNMGLGCGSAYKNEISPTLDTNTVLWDSVKVDSNKVCAPKPPQKGMRAIDPKADTSKVYNRGPK